MEGTTAGHRPVLVEEVTAFLVPKDRPARIIDGTVGYGGHAAAMARAGENVEILGLDRDADALASAAKTLAFAGDRVRLCRGNFSELADRAAEQGWRSVDAVLLDLGVSSPQLDEGRRGFSHRFKGPLDMRMDRNGPVTAGRLLNYSSEEELTRIFREYGELSGAATLARAIVAGRAEKAWTYTTELAALCEKLSPRPRKGAMPAATLCFQALRIAVNDELGELSRALEAAMTLLAPGGRLAVISYHSLEDRLVKHFFRVEATQCVCPPRLPICVCGHRARARVLTKKPVLAKEAETLINRRARSAKLRVAEKLED